MIEEEDYRPVINNVLVFGMYFNQSVSRNISHYVIQYKYNTWQPDTSSSTSSGRKNVLRGDSDTTMSKPRLNALNC